MFLMLTADALTIVLQAAAVESPIQKSAREAYEAMGGVWAGQAPEMKNPKLYENFVAAQIKVLHILTYLADCLLIVYF